MMTGPDTVRVSVIAADDAAGNLAGYSSRCKRALPFQGSALLPSFLLLSPLAESSKWILL